MGRIKGTAQEAKSWIQESLLSDSQKEALTKFVEKFPSLTFYHKEMKETVPAWLKEYGNIILGVDTDDLIWYQFNHFDHSEWDDYKYQDEFYGFQGFSKDVGEYQEILADGEPVFIFACILKNLDSILAVKGGNGEDQAVYDFSYEDIEKTEDGIGTIELSEDNIAFPSYAEMLHRVTTVQFSGGNIVEAEEIED